MDEKELPAPPEPTLEITRKLTLHTASIDGTPYPLVVVDRGDGTVDVTINSVTFRIQALELGMGWAKLFPPPEQTANR